MSEIENLKKELSDLLKAKEILLYSFEKTKILIKKDFFDDLELNDIESFTSRFARLSDMLVQKTLRIIFALDLEKVESVRDRINKAEKMELVDSSQKLIEIRNLRNDISHDYASNKVVDIFKAAHLLCETLFDTVDRIENYILRKYLNT